MASDQNTERRSFRGRDDGRTPHPSDPVATRLRRAGYFADVLADAITPSIYHWIVQKGGSCEVLDSGQEPGFMEALEQAHKSLEHLVGQRKPQPRTAIYAFNGPRR